MTLARSWKRQLFGASGAALLVPGAIAGALVILVFAGGFGRLGALGQALSGPSLPGVARVSATLPGGGKSSLGRALAAAAAPAGTATGPTVSRTPGISGSSGTAGGTAPGNRGGSGSGGLGGSGGSGGGGAGAPGGGAGGGSGGGTGGGTGGTGGSGSPGAGTPGGGSPGGGSPPPTPAPPSMVGRVVGAASALTQQVPGPTGAVATQTVQSVGNTLDRVLPLGDPVTAVSSQLRGSVSSVASQLGLPQ